LVIDLFTLIGECLSLVPESNTNRNDMTDYAPDKRPGEDTIARVLDWVGLAFGLGVIVLVANVSLVVL
jgi:hypothetical protein